MNEPRKHPHIHAHLFASLGELLVQCFDQGYKSDKVLERAFKAQKQWGAKDRRFLAETLYNTVRWRRKLHESIFIAKNLLDLPAQQKYVLMAFVMWLREQDGPSAPEALRSYLAKLPVLQKFDDQIRQGYERFVHNSLGPAVDLSVPDWLWERLDFELGSEKATLILLESNEQAPVYIRANTLKTTAEQLVQALQGENIQAQVIAGDIVQVLERKNIFKTQTFLKGHFEVQDVHSQAVAPFLKVQAGFRVVDGCAGAGGKTLHMAALMKNKGQIVALDVYEQKLEELKRRCQRAGVSCVQSKLIDSTKVIKRLQESADRVLLDVPCSGLGVLRRNPDAKWRISSEELARLNNLQADILTRYCLMTKIGGELVYSTCSILPSENEKQVQKFLEQNLGWHLEEQQTLLPAAKGGDGFFMARLRRCQ